MRQFVAPRLRCARGLDSGRLALFGESLVARAPYPVAGLASSCSASSSDHVTVHGYAELLVAIHGVRDRAAQINSQARLEGRRRLAVDREP